MANGMQPGMQPGAGGMPGGMPQNGGGQVPSPQEVVGAITQRLEELEQEKAQLVQALQEITQGAPQQMAGPQGMPQGMPQGPPQGMPPQGGLLG
jgi:hypothetical protein